MNILSAEKISKSYSGKILLNEVSLGINEGEKIGLIGINGTGKSTFLKIVAGVENPTTGRILQGNQVTIEYLPQNPEFVPGTTVLEQVFKGGSPMMQLLREYENALQNVTDHPENSQFEKELIRLTQKMDNNKAWTLENEAKNILTRLGIHDFQADVSTLSGGRRKRIAIAGALINPATLLILDEPTNHIDNDTVDWLEKYLNKRKGALLIVTHDRYFLDRLVNRIIELDNGNLYSYQANYSKFLEMKAERVELGQASERKRQSLIRTELEWIRRGAQARSTKQKARIDRYENLVDQQGLQDQGTIEIQAGFSRLGRKIITLEHVGKTYPCGEIIRDFSYSLLRDDRLGIIGPNGCGKSTLMKILTGRLTPDTGTVETGETVKIGYFSQENEEMDESLRVIEYIREQAEYLTTKDGEISASQMLERFLFTPEMQWTPVSRLSGGEKRRLFLLRILMGAPNILVLDEPTNDLDIQTLTILEAYLDDFPGAVIAVSHDRYFLDRIVEKIFAFKEDGRIVQYAGNYSDYWKRCAEEEKTDGETAAKPRNPGITGNTMNTGNTTKEKLLKFTYKEQKEFEQIDGLIAGLEENLKEILSKESELSSDYEKLMELSAQKEILTKQLDDALERWTYLNDLAEKIAANSH